MQISAGQDIYMKSGAGSLDASCLNDIRLHSEAGSVIFIGNSATLEYLRNNFYLYLWHTDSLGVGQRTNAKPKNGPTTTTGRCTKP